MQEIAYHKFALKRNRRRKCWEEPNALKMTDVELIPTCSFLQTPMGAPKIKGHNFLPSFCLHDQGETKPKPAV